MLETSSDHVAIPSLSCLLETSMQHFATLSYVLRILKSTVESTLKCGRLKLPLDTLSFGPGLGPGFLGPVHVELLRATRELASRINGRSRHIVMECPRRRVVVTSMSLVIRYLCYRQYVMRCDATRRDAM